MKIKINKTRAGDKPQEKKKGARLKPKQSRGKI